MSGDVPVTRRVIEGKTKNEMSERDRGALQRGGGGVELNYANWRLEETKAG